MQEEELELDQMLQDAKQQEADYDEDREDDDEEDDEASTQVQTPQESENSVTYSLSFPYRRSPATSSSIFTGKPSSTLPMRYSEAM